MTVPSLPRASRRHALMTALLLPLAACAASPGAPAIRAPAAVLRLERMQDQASRGDWAALAATDPGACAGASDAVCAASQALRARACRHLAGQAASAAAARASLDCAVAAGQAALAAAGATPAGERDAWREALAWSLFQRRQVQPRAALCPDNAALREQAEALAAGAAPGPRFLAASARLTDVVEGCAPAARHCAELAEAQALLAPAPAGDTAWAALAAATIQQGRRLACPSR